MAIKKETILQFDAGTKSLKELRNELKELKKQLEDTTIGSQEYQDALQEITERQTQLATITKSSVEDMEGSYNALNKKLAELRTQWKATNDESKRNELGSQMAEINDQLKDMDASVGNFQRNVGNYSSAVEGLGEKYDNVIDRSNKWVESSDQLQKTVTAMVSAMMIANTALDVMGIEGEDADKIMKAFQTTLAVTSGFKAIAEGAKGFLQLTKTINLSTGALKGMKLALISTGIGALVVGIGMLVAHWDDLKELMGFGKQERELASAYKELENAMGGVATRITTETLGAMRALNAELAKNIGNVDGTKKAWDRYNNTVNQLNLEALDEKIAVTIPNAMKKAQENIKYVLGQNNMSESFFEDIIGMSDETLDNFFKKYDISEKYADWVKDARDTIVKGNEELDKAKAEREKLMTDDLTNRHNKAVETQNAAASALENRNKNKKEAGEWSESLKIKTELDIIKDNREKDIKQNKEYYDKKIITYQQYLENEKNIKKKYDTQVKEYNKQLEEERKAKEEETNDEILTRLLKMASTAASESGLKFKELMNEIAKSGPTTVDGVVKDAFDVTDEYLERELSTLDILKANLEVYGDTFKDQILDIRHQMEDLESERIDNDNARKEENLNHLIEIGDIMVSTADLVGSAWGNVFQSITDGIEKVGTSINKGEKGWTKYGKIASAGIGVATNMLSTLAELQDTQTEEGFEKNKKLQIATATMSMLGGIVGVWQSVYAAETKLPAWAKPVLGGVLSAALLATGLAQINQIKSTTFDGGGSASGAEAATPTLTALEAVQSPVDNVNIVEGASTEGEIKDQRVYVVESDISATQQRVRTTEAEAVF